MAKHGSNVTVVAKMYNGHPESLESLVRRFKRKCEKADLMHDMRKHDYYVKPSVKRKLKSKYAQQRLLREERKRNKDKAGYNENDK